MKTEIVQKTSKNGNTYFAIEIYLTPTYKKTVFLERAEVELLSTLAQSKDK